MYKIRNADKINIDIELDEFDLTSSESKATYEQIKKYVLDNFEIKVSSLEIAQVKKTVV